jgi:hypothetical protein
MPLSNQQRAALEAEAKKRGIDPAKLIAEAERMSSSDSSGPPAEVKPADSADAPTTEKPKLFMYLLPFVTVREVRENWLGLSDSFPGDNEIASAWAAKQGGNGGDSGTPPPEGA